jgi:hypothetical protein
VIAVVALALACIAAAPRGDDDDGDARESKQVPEPLLVESITDVDGASAGEYEMDIDFFAVPSVSNSIVGTRVEGEWRASERLGVALELSFAREVKTPDNYAFGARLATSFVLLHDFAHNLHIQAVGTFRAPLETDEDVAHDAAETALPYGAGVHAATMLGPTSFRLEILGEAGDHAVHAPLHVGVVALCLVDGLGYVGAELIQDWALRDPFTIAPEIVFDGGPRGLPFRVGIVVPVHLGVSDDRAFNVITRLTLELDG